MAPANSPSRGFPVVAATAKPIQAPISISPSTPRLITPVRCVSVSPSITFINGVALRSDAAIQEPSIKRS